MEQKAAHTSGPWSVRPSSNAMNGAAWRDIVSDGEAFGPSYVGEALERDAYVIAAAPDLLAACKRMIEWDDREKDHAVDFSARMSLCDAAFNAARAAIAKAEGGAA